MREPILGGDPLQPIVRRFLQIFRGKTSMLGNTCQHLRPDLFTIMKWENIVRPSRASKNAVRSTGLPFDRPTNSKQGKEDLTGSS
jgi:hypothetical protein